MSKEIVLQCHCGLWQITPDNDVNWELAKARLKHHERETGHTDTYLIRRGWD